MDTAKIPSSAPSSDGPFRVAVIYHGDAERRRDATPENSKVPTLFPALAAVGLTGVPVVYHDDFRDQVRRDLLQMHAALVWVNPIEAGHDRAHLDALLREVAGAGVYVSTHPDVIMKIGTKQVLADTQSLSWSAPGTRAHATPQALRAALQAHHAAGETRVLKQFRGHSGQGIWKVEPVAGGNAPSGGGVTLRQVRVREAPRGSPEEVLALDAFVERCTGYFKGNGRMIDQPWQSRLPEGMIRCYLVHDKVEGFGHQAVNALCPAPPGAPRDAFPATSTRLYFPPDKPEFQALKRQLESEWLPQLKQLFGLATEDLPVLWDCDFLLGPKDANGGDTYVLCEINVSSVSPYPQSVLDPLARATLARVNAGLKERHR
ncbi:MAG: Cj0069 family protein [Burkholderiales bacterium]|nr:Cj0069 family protein [Burkholderiales bacterium]